MSLNELLNEEHRLRIAIRKLTGSNQEVIDNLLNDLTEVVKRLKDCGI